MPYCPACHAEIDRLDYRCNYSEYGTETGTCELDGSDCDNSDRDCNDDNTEEYEYECPECSERINLDDILEERPVENTIQPPEISPVTTPEYNENIGEGNRIVRSSNDRIIENKLRVINCPTCHKLNVRGTDQTDDDKVIICEHCYNEIIV